MSWTRALHEELDERAFLVRHLDLVGALALRTDRDGAATPPDDPDRVLPST